MPVPNNPAIELTQMNKAEVAATVFGFAHFLSRIIGERKTPPPTPITPLKNPIPAPVDIEIFKLGIELFISKSFFV